MKTTWTFALAGEGTERLELDIFDIIDDSFFGVSARDVLARMKSAEDVKSILVRINSRGGDIIEGLAIHNLLAETEANVEVHVVGLAASMAGVIAMAGDTIKMSAGAFLMLHNPWGVSVGEADDLRAHADLLDKMRSSLVDVFVGRTGKKAAEVLEIMKAETWFTAEEAKEAGFVDEIVKPKEKAKAQAFAAFAALDTAAYQHVPEAILLAQQLADRRAGVQSPRAGQLELSGLNALPPTPGAPTPPPDGPAEPPQQPIPTEAPTMSEKKTDQKPVEANPTIARALGLPPGAPESEILAAAARMRELEVQIQTITDSKSSAEALGAVKGLAASAKRLVEVEGELTKVKGERDEQEFDAVLKGAVQERKLSPAEATVERDAFAKAVENGRGAEHVEYLKGRMKVAQARVGKSPQQTHAPRTEGGPAATWNGKTYAELSYSKRAELSKEDPELFRIMKDEHEAA